MKKRIFNILIVFIMLIGIFSFFGCNSSKKKYTFTHTNGEISRFEVDFNNNSWNYKGVCIWQTLRMGADYGDADVGMTEKCSGTMSVTNSYEGGDKYYNFVSTTADVNWKITVYVTADQSYIRCHISSSRGYTFYLK